MSSHLFTHTHSHQLGEMQQSYSEEARRHSETVEALRSSVAEYRRQLVERSAEVEEAHRELRAGQLQVCNWVGSGPGELHLLRWRVTSSPTVLHTGQPGSGTIPLGESQLACRRVTLGHRVGACSLSHAAPAGQGPVSAPSRSRPERAH
jgi:hypothetical protein